MKVSYFFLAWLPSGITLAILIVLRETSLNTWFTRRRTFIAYCRYVYRHWLLLSIVIVSGLAGWIMLLLAGITGWVVLKIGDGQGFNRPFTE